jgi:outer membrane lipoprotein SlyB
MKKRLLTGILSTGLLLGPAVPIYAQTTAHTTTHTTNTTAHTTNKNKWYHPVYGMKHGSASRRIGTGAVGGAAIGGIASHSLGGAVIGGAIGAGAGALYNKHERSKGR